MADDTTTTTPSTTDDNPVGHQKAVACAVVGPVVTFLSWICSIKYGLEIPGHIVEALVTFWSTLAVWIIPTHSKTGATNAVITS